MTNQLKDMVVKIVIAEETMRLMELHEMNQCHIMGLQGYKRMHRYNAMDRGRHSIKLQCFMAEYFHEEVTSNFTYTRQVSSYSFVDSLKVMYEKCMEHINMLKSTAKLAFDEGEDLLGDKLECMIQDQSREAEKYNRAWLNASRQNADLNYLSNELHEKYKRKEKEYFNFKM